MVDVECEWCGKTIVRSPRRARIVAKHFCNIDHYKKYKHKYGYYKREQQTNSYQKIKKLAEELKKKKGK